MIDEVCVLSEKSDLAKVNEIYAKGRWNVFYYDLANIQNHWKMNTLNPEDDIAGNNGTSVNQDSSNIKNEANDATPVNLVLADITTEKPC